VRLTRASLVFAALAMLCACSKPAEKSGQTDAATGPSAPLTYAIANADVAVNLALPDAITAYPGLHRQLFDEDRAALDRFANTAGKDHAELTAQGFPAPPYAMSIGWGVAGQTPRLASLYARINTDEGGAHPNEEYHAIIWDVRHGHKLTPRDLFAPEADLTQIDALLCRALEAERSRRAGKPVRQGGNCPRLTDGQVVVLGASQPGKLGGIAVLYAPYEVGPYSEGSYEIRLPLGLIRDSLSPEYAREFSGEPASAPLIAETTPDNAD
jgi:hypothetical protein